MASANVENFERLLKEKHLTYLTFTDFVYQLSLYSNLLDAWAKLSTLEKMTLGKKYKDPRLTAVLNKEHPNDN